MDSTIPTKRTNQEIENDDILTITPLGAGNEVGRSCHIMRYKGKTIMLDCGIHPAYNGFVALPFFDEIDPSQVDLVLITHFHLDHAAALPYFMRKTSFKGRVFMTHPTKAIFKWMLSDYVKVSNVSADEILFDEQELIQSYDAIEAIDYHQEIEIEGIKFSAFNAGHVLGAAMFLIEIAGVHVLYTGDYSREEDRHLMAAEKPDASIDVLICESTYGVQSHEPRLQRELRFTTLVHDIVTRGGRCLIPSFALGRAQELLLILDEYWQAHPELHRVPVYYASSLAKKCMTVYQTYINMMNERIRKQISISNPFVFKHISNLRTMDHFEDVGPCVIMASPGMLQSGLSRELFELWCSDAKNGVIIPGYCVEGTLAKHILSEPTEITSMNGSKLALRMSVEYISFSAHVDFTQNSQFIDAVKPSHLVLVHGDANEMARLRNALVRHYEETDDKIDIHTPKNCESVELYFRGETFAKVIGRKAAKTLTDGSLVSGILVSKDYESYIVDPDDLKDFTDVAPCSILQRQLVTIRSNFSLVEYHLQRMFGSHYIRTMNEDEGRDVINIMDTIEMKEEDVNVYSIEWMADPVNDDSLLAVLMAVESSRASVKMTKHSAHSHSSPCQFDSDRRLDMFASLLKEHFSGVEFDGEIFSWKMISEGQQFNISVHSNSMTVDCDNEDLKKRVNGVVSHWKKVMEAEIVI